MRAEPADDARLVELLERHVTTRGAAARFDWLYRKNPAGPWSVNTAPAEPAPPARPWIFFGRPRGRIVFPRK